MTTRPPRVRRSRAARELARPTADRWAPTLAAFWATNAAATAGITPLRPVRVAARQVGSVAPCAPRLTLLSTKRPSGVQGLGATLAIVDEVSRWRRSISGGQLL